MVDTAADAQAYRAEIDRLNKIIQALMNRAERSTNNLGSDFSLFQSAILLEEKVRRRTDALEMALRENENINRALRNSEARFRGLVNQPLVGIALIEDGKFSYSNPKFDKIFGYGAAEMRMLGPLDVAAESDRSLVAEQLRRRLSGEVDHVDYVIRARRKDGVVVHIEVHGGVMEIDGKLTLISVAMDVTERVRAEREVHKLHRQLREQSTHDSLTGLYNRRYLEESLSREMILAKRHGRCVSVIMGDLDHFKTVNDRYGHPAGDEVLRVFAALLKRQSRGSDICCRYGGEEFLLVLPNMSEQSGFERAEQLCQAIAEAPVRFGATTIAVTASFGVAAFPQHAMSGDGLIAAADRALYAAKEAGRNQVKGCSMLVEAEIA